MQAKIEKLNRRLHEEAFDDENPKDGRDVVVGSLDFEAWYKSFNAVEAGEIVRSRLEKGPSETKVDELELARFLAIGLTDEEIERDNLGELLHTAKEGETKPRFTDQEMTGSEQFREGVREDIQTKKAD